MRSRQGLENAAYVRSSCRQFQCDASNYIRRVFDPAKHLVTKSFVRHRLALWTGQYPHATSPRLAPLDAIGRVSQPFANEPTTMRDDLEIGPAEENFDFELIDLEMRRSEAQFGEEIEPFRRAALAGPDPKFCAEREMI